jgi:hypothetical protein
MKRFRVGLLLACSSLGSAVESVAGHWEGPLRIPGHEFRFVLDLAQKDGSWIGSSTFPGLGIKGAPLSAISVTGSEVSFEIAGVLGGIKVRGKVASDGSFTGSLRQAGNTAQFSLLMNGEPQVDLPRVSTAIAKEIEGDWEGNMMAVDHNVHVRLVLSNHPDGRASAKFLLKGRREVTMNAAMVTQEADLLTLEVPDEFVIYDGRFHDGEISGSWQQGPFDFALVLHRATEP